MKLILQILLILLIAVTFSICTIKPEMHKNVIVYDSDYVLVTENEVKTETKEVPVLEKTTESVKKVTKVETAAPQNEEKNFRQIISQVETKSPQKTTKQVEMKKTTPVNAVNVSNRTNTSITVPKKQEITKTEPVKTETKIITPNVTTKTEKLVKEEPPKTITQQEETIAWNIWRSNLQNQIMKDTKMPTVPNGTIFQFSFTVDRYGKITNVHTGANPSAYTPYAIQYIAPVIRSYQGRAILNFPEGTARLTTDVTGKWRISDTEKYSTPQDYNDIEKVVR